MLSVNIIKPKKNTTTLQTSRTKLPEILIRIRKIELSIGYARLYTHNQYFIETLWRLENKNEVKN